MITHLNPPHSIRNQRRTCDGKLNIRFRDKTETLIYQPTRLHLRRGESTPRKGRIRASLPSPSFTDAVENLESRFITMRVDTNCFAQPHKVRIVLQLRI